MAEDLVSRLRSVLYEKQVVLEPAASISSAQWEVQNEFNNPTLAFISKMLDEEEEKDETELVQQHTSFQGLFDELAGIVSPSNSRSSSNSPASNEVSDGSDDSAFGRTTTFDTYTSLMQCARAVAANDIAGFYSLASHLKPIIEPRSTPLQRLAMFFIEALIARTTGTGPQAFRAISAQISSKKYLEMDVSLPSAMVPVSFSTDVILRACAGAKRVHIVDYGVHCGIQWPSVIKALSLRPEGPPLLKITGIDLPSVLEAAVAGQKLAAYANSCGVQLEYVWIQSTAWESVQPVIQRNELLVVNSTTLRHMKDEWTSINNPRRVLFEKIYRMRPKVFVLWELNGGWSSPFLIPKFDEGLKFCIAKIECVDAWLGASAQQQEMAEKVLQKAIMNVVACDGLDQIDRPDKLRTWDARAKRAGFQPFPIGEEIYDRIKAMWGGYSYNENFRCGRDENWILLGWKDVILSGMSAWQTRTLV